MKKKSKKYVKGSVFAALLLASISVRTVVGADDAIGMEENMVVNKLSGLDEGIGGFINVRF